ncbi:hypothetical protein PACTADRAFT_50028 [Pachysolen tannophilus NRRL Y-2460]|uniref:Manganese/iron superoxide dismutase C-terminal domain-containing protein n=1 Tax=Pachysolen tannophilus NRRL Y-2460 TaxID=669874 RepID=A0A1E4TU52_PACTA|nr:hypothetical protein PACTADRAFT_50028 [Pachysolen tannophilus NRRL Y-2460]
MLRVSVLGKRCLMPSLCIQKRLKSYIPIPTIPHIDSIKDNGIKGLYSEKGLNTVWYKKLEKNVISLEECIEESNNSDNLKSSFIDKHTNTNSSLSLDLTEINNPINKLYTLLNKTAKNVEDYAVFCFASQIYNDYFAISSVGPKRFVENSSSSSSFNINKPDENSIFESPSMDLSFQNEPIGQLETWITESFGSIVEFRTHLLNTNLAIKGNGYTWLVIQKRHQKRDSFPIYENLYIVNTYNSGTPNAKITEGQLFSVKHQIDDLKEKEKTKQDKIDQQEERERLLITNLPTLEEAKEQVHLENSFEYIPLLAINGSPSAYLPDYGVFGKKMYLNNLWDCIDWEIVSNRIPEDARKTTDTQ